MTPRRYRARDFDTWFSFKTRFNSYFTAFGVPILLIAKMLKRSSGKPHQQAPALDMRLPLAVVNHARLLGTTIEAGYSLVESAWQSTRLQGASEKRTDPL